MLLHMQHPMQVVHLHDWPTNHPAVNVTACRRCACLFTPQNWVWPTACLSPTSVINNIVISSTVVTALSWIHVSALELASACSATCGLIRLQGCCFLFLAAGLESDRGRLHPSPGGEALDLRDVRLLLRVLCCRCVAPH